MRTFCPSLCFPAAGAMGSLRSTKSAWTTWTSARRWLRPYAYPAMILFLENDDANCAPTWARNLEMRQGTAARHRAAHRRHRHGVQGRVRPMACWRKRRHCGALNADKITVRKSKSTTDEYELNQIHALEPGHLEINQRPIVQQGAIRSSRAGFWPTAPHWKNGEISLGKNALIGFHDLGGLQPRGRRPYHREDRPRGRTLPSTSRNTRSKASETKLGPEEINARHPQRGRGRAEGPGRARHHPHRRRGRRG